MTARAFGLVALVLVSACGKRIGDPCESPSDCSPEGSRQCELRAPGGYCTIAGCDFGTCPEEAVCVRFFPGVENAPTCTQQTDCAFDEICTVAGECAPRTSEIRFCMLKCESDCRAGYECRDLDLMKTHGGEPVPDPASPTATPEIVPFCAPRRACSFNTDCAEGEVCDFDTRTCRPG